MTFKVSPEQQVERRLMRRALPFMLAVCVPLGVYSLTRAIDTGLTGQSTMVMKDNIRVNTTDVGYLTDAMLLLVPVCALFAWYSRFRLYALAPLAIFFVLKAASGGRGPFVIAAFATALLYFYDSKIKLPSVRLLGMALVIGSFFSFIGQDRGYMLREMLGMVNQTERHAQGEQRFLEGVDFANLEYFEFIVYVVPDRSKTYEYFLGNLQLLTEPIPRVLWPDKPAGAPIKMINFFDYGTPLGMTGSLPGVGWMGLGWAGVIIWCGLWGWATGRFYRWFAGGNQDAFHVTLYLVVYSLLIIGYRDGALLTMARQGLFLTVPVLLMLGLKHVMGIPTLDSIRLKLARSAASAPKLLGGASGAHAKPLTRSERRRLAMARTPGRAQ